MANLNERLLQFDEVKKKKWPYFVAFFLGLLIFIVVIFLFLNRKSVAENLGVDKIFGSESSHKKDDILSNLDENKTYDKASGLITPKARGADGAFVSLAENIGIQINKVVGDSKGYTFDLEFYLAEEGEAGTARVNRIYIDGYDTSIEAFDMRLSYGSSFRKTVNIPKTELDMLGINDFNSLTFNMAINRPEQPNSLYRYFTVDVAQVIAVNNSLDSLVHLFNGENLQINYYKTESDSEKSYIYFDVRDTLQRVDDHFRKTEVMINKLLLNGEIYDWTDSIEIYGFSEKFYIVEVPKSVVKNIETINVSFVVSYYSDGKFLGYAFSNQMQVNA